MTKAKQIAGMRSPLKWAGGKKKIINEIANLLPKRGKKRLVEPFVGGGSVFLNLEFDEYLLVDMNKDLINLFNIIKNQPTEFITDAQKFFNGDYNQPDKYYDFRTQFNQSSDPYERSLLFLYLNRHGYNGLCRYNKSGGYNVPFGRYKHPYFPSQELEYFSEKAQKATFIQGDFTTAFSQLEANDVVFALNRGKRQPLMGEMTYNLFKTNSLMCKHVGLFFTLFYVSVKDLFFQDVFVQKGHHIIAKCFTLSIAPKPMSEFHYAGAK